MKYFLKLLPEPFEEMKNKTKTIEGRPSKTSNDRYAKMKTGIKLFLPIHKQKKN